MTNHDDDDQLAAFDLSAWDVPPPAPGLVDAVIERARQPAPVAALDSGERMHPRTNRRWWIAAMVSAVAIVAILVGFWGVQRTPKDGHGEVSAQAAQTLSIGPTTAALDRGTQVRWRRDKRKVSVAQSRGTAQWNVAADDTLVIDAGAMGATVEASGASLRVEVEMMNASDARAVGISAATAVAVALVTIVVYEGTVRVRHDGQTVNVVPGAQYEVRPPAAPEPITVGAKPPLDPRIQELEDRIKELEGQLATAPQTTCDEVSCVLNNYEGECCQQFKAAPDVAGIELVKIRKVLTNYERPIEACDRETYAGTVTVTLRIAPNGSVEDTRIAATPAAIPTVLTSCIENVFGAATLPRTKAGVTTKVTYKLAAKAPCDADALRQKGDDHLATGMDAAALAAFEQSMKCRPDHELHRKAFLAACRSKNAPKAKLYYQRLPAASQGSLAAICTRLGIAVDEDAAPAPVATCDAALLTQKGDDHLSNGQDAAALASFEKSLACKQDTAVSRKAFMSACRAKNRSSAQKHYASIPTNMRSALAQICIRQGISLDDPPETGVIKINSRPPARVLLDGVDTGQTTPATLQATPGRHKFTLDVRGDKFTYAVTVKAGETVTVSKELE